MAYKILVSPQVQKEIENAIDYFALYSTDAPANFLAELKEVYKTLETNPFFRVRYKNVRAIKAGPALVRINSAKNYEGLNNEF
jgi:hypothetical protein